VDAGIEILRSRSWLKAQITELFFELFNAEGLQRLGGRATLHECWNLIVRRCTYQQSNKQVPEPEVDVEPELFTQAETA
jgi:hypothetical protein